MTKTLFTVGEALAVFLACEPDLSACRAYERITSGAEVNVAAGFVAAGHRARVVTRVGDDALGTAIERDLRRWGIDASLARDDQRHTGVIVRSVGGHDRGDAVNLRRGAAIEALDPAQVDQAWRDDTDVVFVSGTTAVRSAGARAAVERMVIRARSVGALVVVDPNVRPSLGTEREFQESLVALRGRIDIALGDRRELALLAGSDESAAAETLLRQGVQLVVEKRGADGVVAFDAQGSYASAALVPVSDVVDTVGAGDAFAAGVIAALLDGADVPQALERGSTHAAVVVRARGDVPVHYREGVLP